MAISFRRGSKGAFARLIVHPADGILDRFHNQLAAIGDGKARAVLVRAVNRTTNAVHTRVVRAVAKQTSLPQARVRAEIGKRLAAIKGDGVIEGSVFASGAPLSLKEFNPRQFKRGVRAKVWGRVQMFPGAFMGPKPGIIAAGLRGHVFVRTTKARLPIEKMFGPSIPEEMVKDESKEAFEQTVADMLPRRIEHELSRLLS